jgi:hypothetical protein
MFYRNHLGTVYYFFGPDVTIRVECSNDELGTELSYRELPGYMKPDVLEEGTFLKTRQEEFQRFVGDYMISHLSLRQRISDFINQNA